MESSSSVFFYEIRLLNSLRPLRLLMLLNVDVIEAAGVPDVKEITQNVKCDLILIFRGQRGY